MNERIAGIGIRIAEHRRKMNLTQAELAEVAGLSPNNLSKIERGLVEPKLATVVKLAEALNVTPNDLLLIAIKAPAALLDAELALAMANFSSYERMQMLHYADFLNSTRGKYVKPCK